MKHRSIPLRIKSIDETGRFSGYGSVFNVTDSYGEEVVKGAFSRTLDAHKSAKTMPKMLWQHDSKEPIGVYTRMEEDDHGLYLEGQILVDAGATERRAHVHMKAGSVDGLSIGFYLAPGGLEFDSKRGVALIKDLDLVEVSVVTFPANTEARIADVKSHTTVTEQACERFLRDAGLSEAQTRSLMSGGWRAIAPKVANAQAEEALSEALKALTNTFR